MGNFLSGGSSRKTTNTTDNSVVGAQDSVALGTGSRYVNIVTDGGAVEDAVNLTTQALQLNTQNSETALKEALGYSYESMESGYDFADDISRRSFDFADSSLKAVGENINDGWDMARDSMRFVGDYANNAIDYVQGANAAALKQIQSSNSNAVKASEFALGAVADANNPEGKIARQVVYGVGVLFALVVVGGVIVKIKNKGK